MSTRRNRLTVEEYDELVFVSKNRCWICCETKPKKDLYVDRDRRTGGARGLLCKQCDERLGDCTSPEWLRRAAEYLDVGARAFGDHCRTCNKPAPSVLVRGPSEAKAGATSLFEHYCCGKRWTVTYATNGIAWGEWPAPPADRPVVEDAERVGYPDDTLFARREALLRLREKS